MTDMLVIIPLIINIFQSHMIVIVLRLLTLHSTHQQAVEGGALDLIEI